MMRKSKIAVFEQNKGKNMDNKLGLSWAKLKFSLVRAVDEVTLIFNSVEVEIEDIVELSLLVLVGGWVAV